MPDIGGLAQDIYNLGRAGLQNLPMVGGMWGYLPAAPRPYNDYGRAPDDYRKYTPLFNALNDLPLPGDNQGQQFTGPTDPRYVSAMAEYNRDLNPLSRFTPPPALPGQAFKPTGVAGYTPTTAPMMTNPYATGGTGMAYMTGNPFNNQPTQPPTPGSQTNPLTGGWTPTSVGLPPGSGGGAGALAGAGAAGTPTGNSFSGMAFGPASGTGTAAPGNPRGGVGSNAGYTGAGNANPNAGNQAGGSAQPWQMPGAGPYAPGQNATGPISARTGVTATPQSAWQSYFDPNLGDPTAGWQHTILSMGINPFTPMGRAMAQQYGDAMNSYMADVIAGRAPADQPLDVYFKNYLQSGGRQYYRSGSPEDRTNALQYLQQLRVAKAYGLQTSPEQERLLAFATGTGLLDNEKQQASFLAAAAPTMLGGDQAYKNYLTTMAGWTGANSAEGATPFLQAVAAGNGQLMPQWGVTGRLPY